MFLIVQPCSAVGYDSNGGNNATGPQIRLREMYDSSIFSSIYRQQILFVVVLLHRLISDASIAID